MKSSKFAKPGNILAALAIGYCILGLSSCTSRIKIGSVKLPMSVANKWLTNPAASEFIFQFSTTNFKPGEPLQLVMYVMDANGNCLNANDPDKLEGEASKKFDESAILGNNTLTRGQLLSVINDSAGNKRIFDYVLFTPLIDSSFHHIVYDLKLYHEGKRLPNYTLLKSTNPCPPGCATGSGSGKIP